MIRDYNFLKRNGIHDLQQLLSMSLDDLMNIDRRAHGGILYKLEELNKAQNGQNAAERKTEQL